MRKGLVLAGAAVVGLALSLRLWGLTTANELFIDEVTYSRLALSVGRGEWPNLAGEAFYLHPPLTFWLNGVITGLFDLSPDPTTLVFQLRWVNALLGAVVVALGYLLLLRTTKPVVAVVGAVVLAADPFVLRNDSRVMLETPAFALILAGWLCLLIGLERRQWLISVGGFLLGLAVLAKDVSAVPALLPVLLATLWKRTLPRKTALQVFSLALVPYASYVIALAIAGRLPDWWSHKIGGLRRMAGLDQISGFNSPNAPNLLETLLGQLGRFGTSYVLLGLAVPAGVLALRSARADRRLIGLVASVMGMLGLFSLAFGTLEEQMGYFVVVPGVLALGVVAVELSVRLRPALVTATAAVVVAGLAFAAHARAVTDNGYQQARAFLDTQVPPNSRVGLTTPTAQFALHSGEGANLRVGTWTSLGALHRFRADYVLTQSRPLSLGYGYASPDLLPWLARHAEPVFRTTGPSGGDTIVWKLDQAELANAVRTGHLIPEVVAP
ncbi:4-amino-4-deoxy-L-arabinose transferase-like glycosyltransferase [Actinokineospora baliensis]|uniref:ArnT family glycosyltransferase n=1 Tax=Actinokineospora baliensis TaxID=547056 RepID=UPI00195E64FF|nr:glycosyltransferase family 39 protein [Actinokineospora baliensis]MBM7772608.1 4-amino-4-deoxy-L-arabinose transferase-like glycosyltransferase [Actinokineospora baliensis]